uniref:LRR receptor-like serine/threonine-protein kinase At1g74360 family n=1 Tax=Cajanus cajan TaxID=3821 RepID=A0A151TJM9_CAJCA|nr:putative LRR receptor-like serine/threonine-protein kinase At1g74360 family [Cajanus cajan]KYP67247.1 putative LRR receptor-like serine/threonine-protein kinase At1g74360 family [Cajanus cajan]
MWMNFARLKDFSVAENHLNGIIPSEAIPGNCSLEGLDLSQNGFVGNNSFSREIPDALLNLTNLVFLDLSRNSFGGDIQEIFGKFKQVSFLLLHSNNYTGGLISSGILKLPNIWRLDLSYNNFSGPLPVDISQMSSLKFLMLSYNQFNGSIPPQFGNMTQLQALDIAFNNLTGPIPSSLGNLSSLLWLMLANNSLSGEIPPELGNCVPIVVLNITSNKFSGEIPEEVGNMKCLMNLDLSYNNFSGTFPTNLNKLTELNKFNISYNPLISGVVPSTGQFATFEKESYLGNPLLILPDSGSSPWMSDTVKVIRLNKTAFTHDDILKATSSFSEERIIGKGGFGTVYKGVFSDGRHVAVKKLQREGLEGEKEFKAEMEVLSGHGFGWPHPNLVTLYGWCLNGSEKILIYEYIEGGSLEDVVTDRTRLTWRRRLEVATDVARALVYLHHECYPAVVHRDVKASNVLLDKDGKAKVTDFGLARVVDAGDSHVSTMVAGTVGYVAPEYGHTWQATTKGDVYSFGVLVMELATGRRAVDGGEECLVEWARRVMGYGRHHGLGRSVPVLLMGSGLVGGAEEMGELLRVGVRCTADSPQARPNMKEVLAMLIKIYNPKGDSSYGYGHIV